VRRASLKAVMILAGAGLLSRSMSLASDGGGSAANAALNLRVSANQTRMAAGVGDSSAVWAVPLPASFVAGAGEAIRLPRGLAPGGIQLLTVTVSVGGGPAIWTYTNAATLPGLLEALGIQLHRFDRVQPGAEADLFQGMLIRVIRINRQVETVTLPIPFSTTIRYSSNLPAGAVRVVSYGRPGQIVLNYRITQRDGQEVNRHLLAEHITSRPVAQVEIHGTRPSASHVQYGQASWYNMCSGMHAAHLTLPFGTVVTVTNLDNGRTVTVVINDRGPYGVPGRIIDVCEPAFAKIAPLGQGVANVKLTW
jgi:hypothetical protein